MLGVTLGISIITRATFHPPFNICNNVLDMFSYQNADRLPPLLASSLEVLSGPNSSRALGLAPVTWPG